MGVELVFENLRKKKKKKRRRRRKRKVKKKNYKVKLMSANLRLSVTCAVCDAGMSQHTQTCILVGLKSPKR